MSAQSYDVVIIGAGLAGLGAALSLHEKNVKFLLLESSDSVGGRVKTDNIDGFLLDRGFQVFQTSYPEAQRVLDYNDLRLGKFINGALVRVGDKFERAIDPIRHPQHIFSAVGNKVGNLGDKIRTLLIRFKICQGKTQDIFSRREMTTMEYLKSVGFSDKMIERFYRPFLSGVFLERELETSSRKFEFVFRMLSLGSASLPQNGMAAIPQQMANRLPQDSIRFNSRVSRVDGKYIELEGGERIKAENILFATDAVSAHELDDKVASHTYSEAQCVYFKSPVAPITESILVLNGNKGGVVNTLCVPSVVASGYAPQGQHLISLTVTQDMEDEELLAKIREEMRTWFGEQVDKWEHLKTYRIERAIPFMSSGISQKKSHVADHVYCCGDYMDMPSINGAMLSGRRAAEEIQKNLTE
ncbi:NAD(P)/FAD-dependent oxidoreductase [Candidatus Uabimicrobium amorphum]|uniref:Oxidoreductase n=1 Tax=Uabimicrobium amorphum TaxID=2596890 RepID=A0A5S9IJ31_UABAM|nr:NAD(P)/FAD-dependent oxidoreductase [Candidatus Uabimicrobium amorphum]BBM82376.1 oxidoreductase [Candidatus Uabimicrobium amorphum]